MISKINRLHCDFCVFSWEFEDEFEAMLFMDANKWIKVPSEEGNKQDRCHICQESTFDPNKWRSDPVTITDLN